MITNHETSIKDEQDEPLRVAHFLKIALNSVPQGGFSISEQRRRLKLMDVIEAAEDDAEFGFSATQIVDMRKLFDDAKWGALSSDILLISDELLAAAEGTKNGDSD